ncbi:MAG: AbrB/MazE/SpoVT family DNA-binding domain-containing protein [Sphingomonas sp.]
MNMQSTSAKRLKVVKIGNSVGVVLPREVLAKLRIGQGEEIFLSESPNGYLMSALDPDFAEAMAAAETIMREDRDILAVLAR